MTFSYSGYNPQIKLSLKEMLEISQEINQEFAPGVSIEKPELASQHVNVHLPLLQRGRAKRGAEGDLSNKISPNPSFPKRGTERLPQHRLSPKELFEISEEIRQDFAPKASSNTQELVLLPVDPDHLYVYWSLGDDKLNTTSGNDSKNQLTLKIYSSPNKNTDTTKTKSWFDLVIDSARAQQSMLLPKWAHETAYCATIDKRYSNNNLAPFAYSNVTHVPPGKLIPNQFKKNQIVFKAMPQLITASREISTYANNSASGQGNNQ
jgi:hypothetical protein